MLSPHGATDPTATVDDDHADDIVYPSTVPFLLVHLACFAAIWTGVTAEALVLGGACTCCGCSASGPGFTATSRIAPTRPAASRSSCSPSWPRPRRGVLWWAAKHRRHHSHSDTELDVHSPRQHGFSAYVGWIFTPRHGATDYDAIADFARYPELVWLDRHPYLAAALLGALSWLIAGWPGLVVGLLEHRAGLARNLRDQLGGARRRAAALRDRRRSAQQLAARDPHHGRGWHNNHHAYQSSVRQFCGGSTIPRSTP